MSKFASGSRLVPLIRYYRCYYKSQKFVTKLILKVF